MVAQRREQLIAYKNTKKALINLFRDCESGKISSSAFYEILPKLWSFKNGNRLQYTGWERQGKGSNFKQVAMSFVRIIDYDSK